MLSSTQPRLRTIAAAIAACAWFMAGPASAQSFDYSSAVALPTTTAQATPVSFETAAFDSVVSDRAILDGAVTPAAHVETSHACCAGTPVFANTAGFFAGADLLLVRPHFSEALGFVTVTDALIGGTPTRTVAANDFEFDYEVSPRAYLGYSWGHCNGEFRFTYTNFEGEASVSGEVPAPGVQMIDPFGNTINMVGERVDSSAEVETNIYDLEFTRPIVLRSSSWMLSWSAGVRIADVDQFNRTVTRSAGGAVVTTGDFSADFFGAGPRVGLDSRRVFGSSGRAWLYANTHGSLIVGQYDVVAGSSTPGGVGIQTSGITRTVPVFELEVGAAAEPCNGWTVSAGWLFQAWFDLGASGGRFADLYLPADDANIMSFDGLSLRAERRY